jgi:NTE family protein
MRTSPTWAFQDAVVFSGGGNAGAAQVGMIRALYEAGIEPDVFIGCSVGSLNATYLATRPSSDGVDGLERIWRSVGTSNVFGGNRRSVATHIIRRDPYLFEPEGLRTLIRSAITIKDLAETSVPVHVVTTDLESGQSVWWTSGDPVEVLAASACLPGMFPPVRLGAGLHVDGGVLCPVPVGRAIDLRARRVWVLDVSGSRAPKLPERPSALDVLLTSFAMTRQALQAELAPQPLPGQRVVTIEADLPKNMDVRDFTRTSELIDVGFAAAQSAVSGHVAAA